MAAKKTASPKANLKVSKNTREAVETLKKSGRKVHVIGQVVNGQVQLDQSSLNEMARKFPNAKMAFVAVNAPFDPVAHVTK